MEEVIEGKDYSFPREEEKVLELWDQLDAFQEQLRRSEGKPEYIFYDGPPFATGLPHYGHLLAGTLKVRRQHAAVISRAMLLAVCLQFAIRAAVHNCSDCTASQPQLGTKVLVLLRPAAAFSGCACKHRKQLHLTSAVHLPVPCTCNVWGSSARTPGRYAPWLLCWWQPPCSCPHLLAVCLCCFDRRTL